MFLKYISTKIIRLMICEFIVYTCAFDYLVGLMVVRATVEHETPALVPGTGEV